MPRDLLFFRPSRVETIPAKRRRITSSTRFPSFETQTQRVPIIFRELQNTISRQNIHVQADELGLDPEFVLVFEVAGSVESFNSAAKKANMEWLCSEDSECEPDGDFYVVNSQGQRTDKRIPQKVYVTMNNSQAIGNMLSLWRSYCESPDHKLPRGFGGFAKVFAQLRNIRRWGVEDRFSTGVLEAWNEVLEAHPDIVRFEIELWYRSTEAKRNDSENRISSLVESAGGRVIKVVRYDEIRYHALVVELPAQVVLQMMEDQNNELLNEEQVMWFRATGQSLTITDEAESSETDVEMNNLPTRPPLVALLDGMPVANHRLLENRLMIDDPDSFETDYPVANRFHGSGMSSLIIHGDLNAPHSAPSSYFLYVRPIMRPQGPNREGVPNDELLVDLIHRSVLRIVTEADTQSIRIINLSIGSFDRPYFFTMSPESRMLDYLSEKYNILFVVSSGNTGGWLENDNISANDYKNMSLEERAVVAYEDLWNNLASNKILAPSESINSLTIGALHSDFTNIPEEYLTADPLPHNYPAVYSRFGGGVGRAPKPDAMVAGGKQYYNARTFGTSPLSLRFSNARINGPGQKVVTPNSLTATIHTTGTSNSAALTSRMCAQLIENIRNYRIIPSNFEAIAAKCMFIHCCSWDNLGVDLSRFVPQNMSQKESVARWIGYGSPNIEKSMFCEETRATVIGYGTIAKGNYVEYRFPLPNSLQSQTVSKRLTITLAWHSPINMTSKKYKLASLEFKSNCDEVRLVSSSRAEVDNRTSQRGTIQHEVFTGDSASTYEDGTDLVIKVLCKKEDKLTTPVKYVLMATLEVAPETGLPIYQEVAARIQNPIAVGVN